MSKLDLIVGPIALLMIIGVAFLLMPFVTNTKTVRYFLPALGVKLICSVLMGFLYFYYYGGGDTVGYYWGASQIYDVFLEDPVGALRVIFWNGGYDNGIYKYLSRIPYHLDLPSFFVVRVAGFFGLMTLNTYTGIALLFAVISFLGSWALYSSLAKIYHGLETPLAFALLFIPSVAFWSSGVLKDSLTFAALCWTLWAFLQLTVHKRNFVASIIVFLIGTWVLYTVKKYILLTFVPALVVWAYWMVLNRVRNLLIRITILPILLIGVAFFGYRSVVIIGQDDARYSVDKIAETAAITAYDIRYWTGKEAGSGYSLGELDGTWESMLTKAPAAINVSLFRPYLWEVTNPLMFFLALESSVFLVFLVVMIIKGNVNTPRVILKDPFLVFCLVFTLSFAFAVGIATYNFGSLVRYRIPMMPFFACFLVIAWKRISEGTNKTEGSIN